MIGATLEQAFTKMTEPTRDDFMKQLRAISDFQAPLMLRGHLGRHDAGRPARRLVGHRAEVQRQGLRERRDVRVT